MGPPVKISNPSWAPEARSKTYTPKCPHLNCILAPRSRLLGLVALWPSFHKLLIRPPFIVHQTKWLFEQMPLSSQGALFEMEQMTWWWITSAKCTFTRIWLLSCRSDLLPSTYLPLRYQVTHTHWCRPLLIVLHLSFQGSFNSDWPMGHYRTKRDETSNHQLWG